MVQFEIRSARPLTAPRVSQSRYAEQLLGKLRSVAMLATGNPRATDRRFQYDLAVAFAMFVWRASAREQWLLLRTLLNWSERSLAEGQTAGNEGLSILAAAKLAHMEFGALSTAQQRSIDSSGSKVDRETEAFLATKREDLDRYCCSVIEAAVLPEGVSARR